MAGDERSLGPQTRKIIQSGREENKFAISAISFWEIALLVAKNRLELRGEPSQLRGDLSTSGVVELPVTGDIAIGAVGLAKSSR
jgi:PIN domain nuclease of toxin-antitoxin system